MEARLRESFLRELMILQLPQVLSADSKQTGSTAHTDAQVAASSSTAVIDQQNQLAATTLTQSSIVGKTQYSSSSTTAASIPSSPITVVQTESPLNERHEQQHQKQKEAFEQDQHHNHQQQLGQERNIAVETLSSLSTAKKSSDIGLTEQQTHDIITNESHSIDILLLSEQSSSQKITGRSLSANFVACDTNLTHLLLNDLKTPIGTQPSALVRLNDVISITYR